MCASTQKLPDRRRTPRSSTLPLSQNKSALEYASFHILIYSMSLGATALKAVDDSWWVNHISGYEHAVFNDDPAKKRPTRT